MSLNNLAFSGSRRDPLARLESWPLGWIEQSRLAQVLNLSEKTVRRWVLAGRLPAPALVIGGDGVGRGRRVRFDPRAVAAALRAGGVR